MSLSDKLAELKIENMDIATADVVVSDWLRNGMRTPLATLTVQIIVAYEYSKQRSVTVDGWTRMPSPHEVRAFVYGADGG